MRVCAEKVYTQLYNFLKYIINRLLKPCVILKILVGMPFNETTLLNINFTEEKSSTSASFTGRQLTISYL